MRRRHAEQLERDLDEGEMLLAANRVVLVSASSVANLVASARGRDRAHTGTPLATRRLAPRHLKLSTARQLGFPLPGWIFVLGVSNRRVLLWRTSPMLAAPHSLAASLPFDQVAALRGLRRLGATRLSIVLDGGAMVVVQALWSRHLADVAARRS